MNKEQLHLQAYRKCQEIRREISTPQNHTSDIFFDAKRWTQVQVLLNIYKNLLLDDLDRALDRKVEVDLWNVCFKDIISSLQNSVNRDKKAQTLLPWILDYGNGFYIKLLRDHSAKHDLVS